ncbi:sce7725 family protein [Lacticaseibacillus songhuajiangensis]|jgi:hypothetical protein|uniref:sce7725 family protein n=1 Tax=Lacticaseibacillus songhuajiangensis TaxID=1296539 RepID=UPI000F79931A|nr:sce7725 family protein [Lacticaseibacillus songhuajiangensis]
MNYYPLIRGRQYDLLALIDAVQAGLSERIIPIVEPVKDIAALPRLVKAFAKAQHPLYILQNPQVGQYGLLAQPRFPIPYPLPTPVQAARYFDGTDAPAPLLLTQTYAQAQLLAPTQLALVIDEARVRALPHDRRILLADHTPSRRYTADYYTVQDELYQYPLKFQQGVGLADYPLASVNYDEHGYPQRAIALHLLYEREGALWVHHFVSVNNADFSKPGAKFLEALATLTPWLAVHPDAATQATMQLERLSTDQHFPGLGTVRKLELAHWLAIYGRWLDC